MPSSQLVSATETNYPVQRYNSFLDIGELGIFLFVSFLILCLGFWVVSIRTDRSEKINARLLISNLIIVFIFICSPIVWITFTAFNACKEIGVVVPAIISIFMTGIALEKHAERIIDRAEHEAEG